MQPQQSGRTKDILFKEKSKNLYQQRRGFLAGNNICPLLNFLFIGADHINPAIQMRNFLDKKLLYSIL
ncbi:hypothetical protein D4R86_04615 [bacterium]|nr:MAG: hypothetical protein D4R86_04615 [bacterium]